MALSEEEKRLVGGSDVAAIVGVSPYGSAYSVWERIVHGAEREDTPALSRGRRLEPVVLDWYEEHTGRTLDRDVRLRDPGRPHVRASFDAVGASTEGRRGVEAKTAGASEAAKWGEEGTDAIPPYYLCQTQVYLGEALKVGRVDDGVWDVPALIAGDFRLYRVTYDAETYGLLSEAVDRFWVDHVLTRNPPEPTALPNDVEAIQRRFRRNDTAEHLDFATLPPTSQATLAEYMRAYAEESAAAERLALWEARAKLVVGGAAGVRGLPEELGAHRIDWRAQKGKPAWKAVAEALAKQCGMSPEQLSALVAENTGEGARPFTPRPLTKGRR